MQLPSQGILTHAWFPKIRLVRTQPEAPCLVMENWSQNVHLHSVHWFRRSLTVALSPKGLIFFSPAGAVLDLSWKRLIVPKGREIWRVCKNEQNFPSLTCRRKNRFFLRVYVINEYDSQWRWEDLLCLSSGHGNSNHPIVAGA